MRRDQSNRAKSIAAKEKRHGLNTVVTEQERVSRRAGVRI